VLFGNAPAAIIHARAACQVTVAAMVARTEATPKRPVVARGRGGGCTHAIRRSPQTTIVSKEQGAWGVELALTLAVPGKKRAGR